MTIETLQRASEAYVGINLLEMSGDQNDVLTRLQEDISHDLHMFDNNSAGVLNALIHTLSLRDNLKNIPMHWVGLGYDQETQSYFTVTQITRSSDMKRLTWGQTTLA